MLATSEKRARDKSGAESDSSASFDEGSSGSEWAAPTSAKKARAAPAKKALFASPAAAAPVPAAAAAPSGAPKARAGGGGPGAGKRAALAKSLLALTPAQAAAATAAFFIGGAGTALCGAFEASLPSSDIDALIKALAQARRAIDKAQVR